VYVSAGASSGLSVAGKVGSKGQCASSRLIYYTAAPQQMPPACATCSFLLPAVVFDMHYNELLLKNEEIERLKTVIEGLGGGS
jgi:hypothetical protein